MMAMRQEQRVIPAIIPEDEAHLVSSLQAVAFAHELHLDVVDGRFVTPVSWPYNPAGNPVDHVVDMAPYSIEVDLMVEQPLAVAETWLDAGAQRSVFHVETISVAALTDFKDAHDGVTIGVSALNDTPWETLLPFLTVADYVQVMGIGTIGAQGAPFDSRALDRITTITEQFPTLEISVDGSVNQETIEQLRQAGAGRFVVGSAIMRAPVPQTAYQDLEQLARPQQ